MNDNVPLGANEDSNAPWNQSLDQKQFEEEFDDAIQGIREALADDLPDLIWEYLKHTNSDVREAVYDVMYDEIKRLWEG